ncbi:MAG: DNA-processing protein DprA [Candidatus Izemoplasmataceae bacterium]
MNNLNVLSRFLAWSSVLQKYPQYFESLFSNLNKLARKSTWEGLLYKNISTNSSDKDILNLIFKNDHNLLENDFKDQLYTYYLEEKRNIFDFYSNTKYSFITSLDESYPEIFKEKLLLSLNNDNNNTKVQYIPNVFIYRGEITLLNKDFLKRAVIGTREPKNESKTKDEIRRIFNKYPKSVCVTGLASGIDTFGINIFTKSICFIGEDITNFINKKQRDLQRLEAKKKVLQSGLILSHKLPHDKLSSFDFKTALLERNLFVTLISDTIHPIEYGIKSGTISAINYAIYNNKPIYTPKALISDEVQKRFKDQIEFY